MPLKRRISRSRSRSRSKTLRRDSISPPKSRSNSRSSSNSDSPTSRTPTQYSPSNLNNRWSSSSSRSSSSSSNLSETSTKFYRIYDHKWLNHSEKFTGWMLLECNRKEGCANILKTNPRIFGNLKKVFGNFSKFIKMGYDEFTSQADMSFQALIPMQYLARFLWREKNLFFNSGYLGTFKLGDKPWFLGCCISVDIPKNYFLDFQQQMVRYFPGWKLNFKVSNNDDNTLAGILQDCIFRLTITTQTILSSDFTFIFNNSLRKVQEKGWPLEDAINFCSLNEIQPALKISPNPDVGYQLNVYTNEAFKKLADFLLDDIFL